jgi:hypothetical protein
MTNVRQSEGATAGRLVVGGWVEIDRVAWEYGGYAEGGWVVSVHGDTAGVRYWSETGDEEGHWGWNTGEFPLDWLTPSAPPRSVMLNPDPERWEATDAIA